MTDYIWSDSIRRDGATQMALDTALLDLAREQQISVLRVYQWSTDTVSFGAHEAATRAWSRTLLEAANVPAVRRPTGGRAVHHAAADLTYAVTKPLDGSESARDAYRIIHERLAFALRSAGLAPAIASRPARHPGIAGGACFDVAMGGELTVAGHKVVGSAQLVRGGALLQHGAIAASDPIRSLAPFARDPRPVPTPGAYIMLPDTALIAEAIAVQWHAKGASPLPREIIETALTRMSDHLSLYRSTAWTWRR